MPYPRNALPLTPAEPKRTMCAPPTPLAATPGALPTAGLGPDDERRQDYHHNVCFGIRPSGFPTTEDCMRNSMTRRGLIAAGAAAATATALPAVAAATTNPDAQLLRLAEAWL